MSQQSQLPWYVTFFDRDYLRMYTPFLPPKKTEQEVKDIIALLNLQQGDHFLDLCCGYGRHAIPLARYGCNVTGLDLSSLFLQQAQEQAEQTGTRIRWCQGDMQNIPFVNEFDYIINVFTSFGYFPQEEDDQRVLFQVAKALKPGGKFLLETVYQPRIIRNTSPHGIIRYDDGLIVLEERHIDLLGSRNEVHISLLYPNGTRTEHHQSIRIYTLTEIIRMLTAAGLQMQAYYGGLDGSTLSLDSRLVLVSKKADSSRKNGGS